MGNSILHQGFPSTLCYWLSSFICARDTRNQWDRFIVAQLEDAADLDNGMMAQLFPLLMLACSFYVVKTGNSKLQKVVFQ